MGVFLHSFWATDLNFGTKYNGRMKYLTLKTLIFANYWDSLLVQFSKFKNFLWVYWFLGKNLSNPIYPVWKLHNPYCHNWTTPKYHKFSTNNSEGQKLIKSGFFLVGMGWRNYSKKLRNKTRPYKELKNQFLRDSQFSKGTIHKLR